MRIDCSSASDRVRGRRSWDQRGATEPLVQPREEHVGIEAADRDDDRRKRTIEAARRGRDPVAVESGEGLAEPEHALAQRVRAVEQLAEEIRRAGHELILARLERAEGLLDLGFHLAGIERGDGEGLHVQVEDALPGAGCGAHRNASEVAAGRGVDLRAEIGGRVLHLGSGSLLRPPRQDALDDRRDPRLVVVLVQGTHGEERADDDDVVRIERPRQDDRTAGERVPLVDVRFFVTAVLIQRETGGNLSEILDSLSHVVRERFKILRQVRVYTAHGRLTGYVLMALPAALAITLSFINPDHVNLLFEEHLGHMMILAAIVLQVVGYIWISQVVKIEV